MSQMGLRDSKIFYMLYVLPSLDLGLIEYTIPNKPNSRLQKYRLTAKGRSAVAHERRKDYDRYLLALEEEAKKGKGDDKK